MLPNKNAGCKYGFTLHPVKWGGDLQGVTWSRAPARNERTATSQQRREREKVSDTTRHREAEGERAETDTGNVAGCRQRLFSAELGSCRSLEFLDETQKRKAHTSAGDKLLLGCFVLGTGAQLW